MTLRSRRSVQVVVFFVTVLCCVFVPGCKPEDKTRVRVRLAKGAPAGAVLALVDPTGPRVLAKSSTGELDEVVSSAAIEVWGGAPAFDLWREKIGEREEVVVNLVPASGSALLQLSNLGGSDSPALPTVSLNILYSLKPSWTGAVEDRPFSFTEKRSVQDGAQLSIPRGFWTRLVIESDRYIVSPAAFDPEDGHEYRVGLMLPRSVALRQSEGTADAETQVKGAYLSYASPPPSDGASQDAILWWMSRPNWWSVRRSAAGLALQGLPPVECHLFFTVGDVPCYALVGRSDTAINFGGWASRVLREAPTIAGARVPEGTRIFAGRLDFLTVAELNGGPNWRVFSTDCSQAAPNAPVSVPVSESTWFTLVAPDRRIAFGRWSASGTQVARWEAGEIRIIRDASAPSINVTVFPVWGKSRLRMSTSAPEFTYDFVQGQEAVVRALPIGDYAGAIRMGPSAKSAGRLSDGQSFQVSLTEEVPVAQVRLKPDEGAR